MKLKEYLDSKDITVTEFAAMLGVSPPTVYAWIKKKTRILKTTAKRVEELTNGAVTAISLRRKE